MSKFSKVPSVSFNRSRFNLSHGLKTSFNVGELVPIEITEVLPGDSFSTKTTAVARVTSSFIKPVMDNAFLDIHHFFIPYRLLYDDYERVFGNPNPSAYIDNQLAEIPKMDKGICYDKTVADYLGLPLGLIPEGVSILPFRAFALVYDQWFRNQNTVDEMFVQKGELGLNEVLNDNPWSPNNYTGKLPKVSKKKDYFTACLPSPQKGAPVSVPIGVSAPVVSGQDIPSSYFPFSSPMKLADVSGNTISNIRDLLYRGGELVVGGTDVSASGAFGVVPKNLYADLSNATSANINDLRLAFQTQKMLERDSLYGSRINEFILGHFGVHSPDARLQFTEYLGGGRIPIGVQQVAQTSQSTEDSPLANVSGYSLSNGFSKYSKGFTEHGYVLTVCCIKTMHTYQQGIPRSFFRTKRNDFYDPLFANLGEQPVYTSELFVNDDIYNNGLKSDIFGYNEAWADYRYKPSQVTGEMRSLSGRTLDIWHFADKYASAPVLSEEFTNETTENIDRTLSVPSQSQNNFIVDFWFETKAIRVLPVYSVPGLIDHH